MSRNYYTSGQWNLICDVCGKKIKSGKSRHRWDGFVVCEDDYEQRHPQDFIRSRQDKITIPFNRPRPTDLFTETCTLTGRSAFTGLAVSGCAITALDDDSWKQYLGL